MYYVLSADCQFRSFERSERAREIITTREGRAKGERESEMFERRERREEVKENKKRERERKRRKESE